MGRKRTKRTSAERPTPEARGGGDEAQAEWADVRKRVDEEAGRSMRAYEARLRRANSFRVLEFAARSADRAWRLGVVLQSRMPAEASGLVEFVTSQAALAARLADEAAHDPGRLNLAESVRAARLAHRKIALAEVRIYAADCWSHAVLELARVATRLFEAIREFDEGDDDALAQRASSVAAHALQAMLRGAQGDLAEANRSAILADLAALTHKGAPKPFPSRWPADSDPFIQLLNERDRKRYKEKEESYKNLSVADIRYEKSKEPPPGLESLRVPKLSIGEESLIGNPKVYQRAAEVEERSRLTQQRQIDELQRFLNLLAGKGFGSHAAHKSVADFITKLAARANAHLTISGEFPDPKDAQNIRVFTLEPVTVRCDNPKTKSILIRTSDKRQISIVSAILFPQLYAIPKRQGIQ